MVSTSLRPFAEAYAVIGADQFSNDTGALDRIADGRRQLNGVCRIALRYDQAGDKTVFAANQLWLVPDHWIAAALLDVGRRSLARGSGSFCVDGSFFS